MPQSHEYKLIVGTVRLPVNDQLREEGRQGWKPILMSTAHDQPNAGANLYLILERALGAK
jgi:hypothetical protein